MRGTLAKEYGVLVTVRLPEVYPPPKSAMLFEWCTLSHRKTITTVVASKGSSPGEPAQWSQAARLALLGGIFHSYGSRKFCGWRNPWYTTVHNQFHVHQLGPGVVFAASRCLPEVAWEGVPLATIALAARPRLGSSVAQWVAGFLNSWESGRAAA